MDIHGLKRRNMELLAREHEAQGIPLADYPARSGRRISRTTAHRILHADESVGWDKLAAMADVLGVQLLDQPPPRTYPACDEFEVPIVAETQGLSPADASLLFLDDAAEPATISLAGLVALRVSGSSALPLYAHGQVVLADPMLHPDDAPPHPDFPQPIAVVRVRDGRQLLKRWHRLTARTVRLLALDASLVGADGLPAHLDVPSAQIEEAWTVRGGLYW